MLHAGLHGWSRCRREIPAFGAPLRISWASANEAFLKGEPAPRPCGPVGSSFSDGKLYLFRKPRFRMSCPHPEEVLLDGVTEPPGVLILSEWRLRPVTCDG